MWLCLHLPRCALEALRRYLPSATAPVAVVADDGGCRRIILADDAATSAGITYGMRLSAARTRVPSLLARQRDPAAETALLARLSAHCLRFTSHVHRPEAPPDAGAARLLLEVGGSLSLFGGLAALTRTLTQELTADGYTVTSGAGRTPLLAMLRARARAHGRRDTRVATLPLGLLELSDATRRSLQAAGLTRIDEVFALPRVALARRYGPACLAVLDRLAGRRRDPRPALKRPAHFSAELDLPADLDDVAVVRFALHGLIDDLAVTLRAADAAVTALHLTLIHADIGPTRLNLGFAAPVRDAARIDTVLAARLDNLVLPAPVRGLRVDSSRFTIHVPAQGDLFQDQAGDPTAWHELLDRLQARLGRAALAQPQCRSDHRPEQASRPAAVGAAVGPDAAPSGARPVWLLRAAEQLPEQPMLLRGPERIESGWWEHDCFRDYYVARDGQGRRVWVYREGRAPHRWFRHGIFA